MFNFDSKMWICTLFVEHKGEASEVSPSRRFELFVLSKPIRSWPSFVEEAEPPSPPVLIS